MRGLTDFELDAVFGAKGCGGGSKGHGGTKGHGGSKGHGGGDYGSGGGGGVTYNNTQIVNVTAGNGNGNGNGGNNGNHYGWDQGGGCSSSC